ncbi:hypothetical protein GCM10010979_06230 [Conyzicola nivalis]|uniref:Uncharacterized protein n=1 Tax=Conyzicola nivalis TaxID=1477021 RepID=A0A916SG02_9MICO|nr:hypothetical protein GCM10010979_06230 [Conyzicola nivalis]
MIAAAAGEGWVRCISGSFVQGRADGDEAAAALTLSYINVAGRCRVPGCPLTYESNPHVARHPRHYSSTD